MNSRRFLSEENLLAALGEGIPRRFTIRGQPQLELLADPVRGRLSLLLPRVQLSVAKYRYLVIAEREVEGETWTEIACETPRLFSEFYELVKQVADACQLESRPAREAIEGTFDAWKDLFSAAWQLNSQEEAGLYGELWLLTRLLRVRGPSAVQAWTAGERESHDFRLEAGCVEVKTTLRRSRVHRISSAEQLRPNPQLPLFLLSLQLAPAGLAGTGVSDVVGQINELLDSHNDQRRLFHCGLLRAYGYNVDDPPATGRRFVLRNSPYLIRIDEQFPALTIPLLAAAVGEDKARRIVELTYDIDVEGLGVPDDTPEFLAVLPSTGVVSP